MSSLCASGSRDFFDGIDREPNERRADGNIDQERPAPAERGGDDTADERTHGDRDAEDRSPESERLGSFRTLERVPEHRQRRAKLNCGAHALQRSRRVQNWRGWRETAQQRRQGEYREADSQHPTSSIPIRERSRGHQKRGKGEDIGADHPFDIGECRIEIAGDGRQRDRDDVRIEHDHERHARGAKQDARSPPAHPSHWTLSRLRRGCQSLLRHDAAVRSVWPSRGS